MTQTEPAPIPQVRLEIRLLDPHQQTVIFRGYLACTFMSLIQQARLLERCVYLELDGD